MEIVGQEILVGARIKRRLEGLFHTKGFWCDCNTAQVKFNDLFL